MPAVVVIGDMMVDIVALLRGPLVTASDSPARITTRGGGSAANTACWLASTGVETVFVGRVGDDSAGREAVGGLRAHGVRTAVAVDPVRPTGTVIVLVDADGERTMVPDVGANAGLTAADLPVEEFLPGRHLHLSGYTLLDPESRAAGLAALGLARDSGMSTSVDPSSVGPLAALGPDRFLAWIDGVDLLLANQDEARILTGCADPVDAARKLAQRCGEVVVKSGELGAMWLNAATETPVVVPAVALPPPGVVDTTGAGDAFAAGFLPAWLDKAAPGSALAAACLLASQAVARIGGRPDAPNSEP